MPKVFLTDGQRRTEHIKKVSRWTRGKLMECGFDQKDLANYICESESKISRRFATNNASLSMVLGVIEMCNVQPEELNRVMGRNK